MDEQEFLKRWYERITFREKDAGDIWKILVSLFGITAHQISVEKLTTRLGGGSPPLEFCRQDFGFSGPVIDHSRCEGT